MSIRLHYLDTSAAVKLLVQEEGSEKLQQYMKDPDHSSNLFMTSFCVAETIGVVKRKFLTEWIKEHGHEKAQQKYLDTCAVFIGQLEGKMIEVHDIPITDPNTFSKVDKLAKRHRLDVIDAFQLVTLKEGFVSPLRSTQSECCLITADYGLAKAAREEGLKVWDYVRGNPP